MGTILVLAAPLGRVGWCLSQEWIRIVMVIVRSTTNTVTTPKAFTYRPTNESTPSSRRGHGGSCGIGGGYTDFDGTLGQEEPQFTTGIR